MAQEVDQLVNIVNTKWHVNIDKMNVMVEK